MRDCENLAANFVLESLLPYMDRVGEWSERNFKDQKGLGCFAPLLGIGEELLYEEQEVSAKEHLTSEQYYGELRDCYFDAMIFGLDVLYRSRVHLYEPKVFDRYKNLMRMDPYHFNEVAEKQLNTSLSLSRYWYHSAILYGKLLQIMLKRVQGIRGYADNDKFANDFTVCILLLLKALVVDLILEDDEIAANLDSQLLHQRFTTTVETVLKRDWTKPNGQLS